MKRAETTPAGGPAVDRGPVNRGSGDTVQSVLRALDLFDVLADADEPLGVGHLARVTGLPLGTAHRLLRSLAIRGYVRHDSARKYSVGAAALRVAEAAQRSLARAAKPFLAEAVALTGESANLAIFDGGDVVYIAQVPSPHSLRIFAEVGRHVPAHSTAVGKVLLADLPTPRVEQIVERRGLEASTPHTITERSRLGDELATVRTRGWATDEGEQEAGVRCVAAPVGSPGQVVAAVSVSGPTDRFAGAGDENLVGDLVAIARRLGAAVADSTAPRAGEA